MMRHDHHKKCLDDSLVVDKSSGPSRGCSMTVAIVGAMSSWRSVVRRWFRLAWSVCC